MVSVRSAGLFTYECGTVDPASPNNIEVPVLFRKFDNLHVAKLGSVNGMVRDIEGDIIQDNTVVEFYYNDDSSIHLYLELCVI